jgi:hypothetical protein
MTLMKHWTPFPGRPHGRFVTDKARVTISDRGVIYLNELAWIALRRPEAVELMFDKGRRMIGIKETDPLYPTAFPVKPKPGTRGRIISASAFCTHFLIKAMRTGLFNSIEIDDEGMMSLHLDSLSAVSRGAR